MSTEASLFARYTWHWAIAQHLLDDPTQAWFCRFADPTGRALAIVPAYTAVGDFGFRPAISLGWDAQLILSDFPMAPEADPQAIAGALIAAFRSHPYPWQVISWGRVLADSNAARIARALNPGLTLFEPTEPCHIFDTTHGTDANGAVKSFTVISKGLRAAVRQGLRNLKELGPVHLKTAKSEHDLDGFLAEFLRVEAAGWKGAAGTAVAFLPRFEDLMRTLLRADEPDVQADIALLYCGPDAVAAQFRIVVGPVIYLYKSGYDERFESMQPGHVMKLMMLNEAIADHRLDSLSMVSGPEWVKAWRPIELPTLDVLIFRSRLLRTRILLRRAASRVKTALLKKK